MNHHLLRRVVLRSYDDERQAPFEPEREELPAIQQRPRVTKQPKKAAKARKREKRTQHLRSVKSRDMTWHDHLAMLLQVAAAIEHALMVQYLYAAYSIGGSQIPPQHRQDVEQWRASLIAVAMEEMGHMLTLQNVLMFVGAPINLDRGSFPWDARYYPFPFKLEPLTLDSLACYVYAEMPSASQVYRRRKEESYKRFIKTDRAKITESIERRDRTPHQIGLLYRELIALMKDDKRIPDTLFRDDTYTTQAGADDWGRGYQIEPAPHSGEPSTHQARVIVSRIATRIDAIEALKAISAQGEGPDAGSAETPSHFDRLLEVYQEYTDVAHQGWSVSLKVPINPTTLNDREAGNVGQFIRNHCARYWAYLFNLRYRMLLTYLSHTFRLARATRSDEPSIRAVIMHRVFGEMYNLKTVARVLVRLPYNNDTRKRRKKAPVQPEPSFAGPPFEMPYTLRLPSDDADCLRFYRGMLATSKRLCRVLLKVSDDEDKRYLRTLCDLDSQYDTWIEQVLAGGNIHERRPS